MTVTSTEQLRDFMNLESAKSAHCSEETQESKTCLQTRTLVGYVGLGSHWTRSPCIRDHESTVGRSTADRELPGDARHAVRTSAVTKSSFTPPFETEDMEGR